MMEEDVEEIQGEAEEELSEKRKIERWKRHREKRKSKRGLT